MKPKHIKKYYFQKSKQQVRIMKNIAIIPYEIFLEIVNSHLKQL